MDEAALIKKVMAFVNAESWEKWEVLVRRESALLLSPEADALLAGMQAEASGQEEMQTVLELRRSLLRRARETGIDATFAHLKGPVRDDEADASPLPSSTSGHMAATPPTDPEETMFHPDVYRAEVLKGVLQTYDLVMEMQRGNPLDYGQTQLNRAKVLHQLAGMKGENRPARMQAALDAYDAALTVQADAPRDYARTQGNRAILLYQLAALPHENHIERLRQALEAYDEALERLHDIPHAYARVQLNRVALLRDIAGLPGEVRAQRLYQALEGFDRALECQQDAPLDYAKTQLHRANLLRELAGLKDERPHRPQRMYQALEAYDEALRRLSKASTETAVTQINRASLLQEIAGLPEENRTSRLRQALNAAIFAVYLLENDPYQTAQYRAARRMLLNTRQAVIHAEGEAVFNQWWDEIAVRPQPDWLTG